LSTHDAGLTDAGMSAVAATLHEALPALPGPLATEDADDLGSTLEEVAREALTAMSQGTSLAVAARSAGYPALRELHQSLRDALLMEIPRELEPWVKRLALAGRDDASQALTDRTGAGPSLEAIQGFVERLVQRAREDLPAGDAEERDAHALQIALATVLLFESVRLRLLITAWSSEDWESVGGDEGDLDDIAWQEITGLLREPALADPSIRPLAVIVASAAVAMARESADRASALHHVGESTRSELRVQAKLRASLRDLRLTEAVLLENAFAHILGEDRVELPELQTEHPLALGGMSRQAMDQRVSRSRRALFGDREHWPTRTRPALFDLLRRGEDD
jgi:HPt (histidine-containing phosphotransfer) domain-containing protein